MNKFSAEDELLNIKKALDEYSDLTDGCIQWVPRSGESDYVYIQSDDSGCHSNVGEILYRTIYCPHTHCK